LNEDIVQKAINLMAFLRLTQKTMNKMKTEKVFKT
jgi:hypothetical protein